MASAVRGMTVLLSLLLVSPAVLAHAASTSYLTIDSTTSPVQLRWDVALRDLATLLPLDADGDRLLRWRELHSQHRRIAQYLVDKLRLEASSSSGESVPCALSAGEQRLSEHADGSYNVLPLSVDCGEHAPDRVTYSLLFERDPLHRAIVQLIGSGGERLSVFSPQQRTLSIDTTADAGVADTAARYLSEGIRHIAHGTDHLLFLLTLMLPMVLVRRQQRWQAESSAKIVGAKLLGVISAFTLAHSLTVTLAVLGLVSIPTRWVESAIAATVLLAAVNNLHPFLPGRPWAVAFALGLVHGLGFASALQGLELSPALTAIALGAFNIGVELGQLGLVALLLPLAFVYRDKRAYQSVALRGGSLLISGIAIVWLFERSFDLQWIAL